MLESFLKVAAERARKDSDRARTSELMSRLPKDTLYDIASGREKLGSLCGDDGDWLEKFKGTPLLTQAVELLQAEIQLEQQDLEDRERRRQERESEPDTWAEKDQIRIQRKLLDLELAKLEAEGAEEAELEEEVDAEAPTEPAAPSTATPPSVEEPPGMGPTPITPEAMKEAAARMQAALRKLSACKSKMSGELPSALKQQKIPKGTDLGKPGYVGAKKGPMPEAVKDKLSGSCGSTKKAQRLIGGDPNNPISYYEADAGPEIVRRAGLGMAAGTLGGYGVGRLIGSRSPVAAMLAPGIGTALGGIPAVLKAREHDVAAKKRYEEAMAAREAEKTSEVEERFRQTAQTMLLKQALAQTEGMTELEKEAFWGALLRGGKQLVGATKGLGRAVGKGWGGQALSRSIGSSGATGLKGGLEMGGRYLSTLAKKSPWLAAGTVAAPVALGAGALGMGAGRLSS